MQFLKDFLYSVLVISFFTHTTNSAVLTEGEEEHARAWLANYAYQAKPNSSLEEKLQELDQLLLAEHINNPIKGEWSLLHLTVACLMPDSVIVDSVIENDSSSKSRQGFLTDATLALRYLLKKPGIDVNATFKLSGYEEYGFYPGDTALIVLSRRVPIPLNLRVIKMLIENDADLEARDKDNNTPVIVACQFSKSNYHRMAKFLVSEGAIA